MKIDVRTVPGIGEIADPGISDQREVAEIDVARRREALGVPTPGDSASSSFLLNG
jgi:hypothetical protein